jgi:hypothetical protein
MNLCKLFEGFNRQKIDELVDSNKTYVFKRIRDFLVKNNDEYNRLINLLRSYDFNKFDYTQNGIDIRIVSDEGYMKLYKQLYDLIIFLDIGNTSIFRNDLKFYLTVRDGVSLIDFVKGKINLIDFDFGIPDILMGTSLGYNLYKLVIKHNYYISSNKFSEKVVYNLWYNLLQDKDLCGITSNSISVVISKNLSDDKLRNILDCFPKNLEYDDDLKIKIIDLYGSMDVYAQG